jgi:hypothetical protein
MRVGVQFTGTVPANQAKRWFTYNWPQQWHTIWYVVPISPDTAQPELQWSVQVERTSDTYITYWISISNLTSAPINIEARYAVLN